ncbi:MAG: flippase-like domain-containing protein [Verrucomicrobia bacterium]|nr:flippase-like domain-containing protein [Verrucomicrobiota bacterium]
MKAVIRLLLLGVGLALLAWFIRQAGPGQIFAAFVQLHWQTVLVLIPYVFVYLADAMGWRFAFGRNLPPGTPFRTLLRIRWAGEAVNNVVPSAYIGGEALKVYLLQKRGVATADGTSSVVAGKTAQTLSQVLFLAIAACALSRVTASGGRLDGAAWVAVGVILTALAVLFWLQKIGPFSLALRLLQVLRVFNGTATRKLELMRSIDDRLLEFYRRDRKHFCLSATSYLAGWLLGTLEVLTVAYLLGTPIGLAPAVVIEAFVGVAKIFGVLVPGALGVQETGIVLMCRVAGLPDPFGVSYAILRRGREVVFALIGLTIVYAEEFDLRRLRKRLDRAA